VFIDAIYVKVRDGQVASRGFTPPSVSTWPATTACWTVPVPGVGSRRSSGCRCSPSWRTAASPTCSFVVCDRLHAPRGWPFTPVESAAGSCPLPRDCRLTPVQRSQPLAGETLEGAIRGRPAIELIRRCSLRPWTGLPDPRMRDLPPPGYGAMVTDSNTAGFAAVLGVRDRAAQDGTARLRLDATEDHLNEAGTVHGGVLATLLDMAMGQAVRSSTGESDVPATSQLTVTYLRPGKPGTVEVSARVSKQGENLTVCEADVEQDGRPLAHALATFAVLHR
jgi:uncharacterized protein (TIGR00369 family)